MKRAVDDLRERRRFPRPPLWLNLLLLILAGATFAYARHQRTLLDEKLAIVFRPSDNSPEELNALRERLAETDLTRRQLATEIDGRMQFLDTIRSAQFYLTIDTARRKMDLRIGRDVAREMDVDVGASRTITAPGGRTWTFLALKGAFSVVDKQTDYLWNVPAWLPSPRREIPNGLGKYVIVLPNHYVIHSPPPPDSPLQGPKPGSFMVSEEDLAAIWPRISKATRVYIF